MKKLSELSNDIMLCVANNYDGDIQVMSKEEFLDSAYYLDYPVEPFPTVTIGDIVTQRFDLGNIIYNMSDDMYEDWDDDVMCELKGTEGIAEFELLINKILERHPTYYEGEKVEIDM